MCESKESNDDISEFYCKSLIQLKYKFILSKILFSSFQFKKNISCANENTKTYSICATYNHIVTQRKTKLKYPELSVFLKTNRTNEKHTREKVQD